MTRVQVVYASRHGGTAGIGERIAEVLKNEGLDVVAANAAGKPNADGFDAYVIGSGVYIGRWLDEGLDFLERNGALLATKPVWLFSSGPVAVIPKTVEGQDPLEPALGPADGPGSGGHKRIAAISELVRPRDHHVFSGVFDPTEPAKSLQERLIRMMPAAKATLPAGDFRDWAEIEDWARGIARELTPVASGSARR